MACLIGMKQDILIGKFEKLNLPITFNFLKQWMFVKIFCMIKVIK